jgi:acyl carrier protein
MEIPRPVNVAAILTELLAHITHGRVDPKSLAAATPLDLVSVEVLELVVGIEDRLGVELRGDDVAPENVATFGQLVALVASRCRA